MCTGPLCTINPSTVQYVLSPIITHSRVFTIIVIVCVTLFGIITVISLWPLWVFHSDRKAYSIRLMIGCFCSSQNASSNFKLETTTSTHSRQTVESGLLSVKCNKLNRKILTRKISNKLIRNSKFQLIYICSYI